jgi:hypothetical protein
MATFWVAARFTDVAEIPARFSLPRAARLNKFNCAGLVNTNVLNFRGQHKAWGFGRGAHAGFHVLSEVKSAASPDRLHSEDKQNYHKVAPLILKSNPGHSADKLP